MTYSNKTCFFTALLALSVSACGGAADRDHDHEAGHEDASSASHAHDESGEVDHSRFGHMSAIYLCGNDELQTTHTDIETKLPIRARKSMSRELSPLLIMPSRERALRVNLMARRSIFAARAMMRL